MTCWYCGSKADVLTVSEIAERLETSARLVQSWIYAGKLEADRVEVGPCAGWRIRGEDFWRFLQLDQHQRWLVRLAGGDPTVARRLSDRLRARRRHLALALPTAA